MSTRHPVYEASVPYDFVSDTDLLPPKKHTLSDDEKWAVKDIGATSSKDTAPKFQITWTSNGKRQ